MMPPDAGLDKGADCQHENAWSSRRPWSLWDMIYKFNVERFTGIIRESERLATVSTHVDSDELRSEFEKAHDIQIFGGYRKAFESLELHMCAAQIDRITSSCTTNDELSNG